MNEAWVVLLVIAVAGIGAAGLYFHLKVDKAPMSPWPPIVVLAVLGAAWLVLQAVT